MKIPRPPAYLSANSAFTALLSRDYWEQKPGVFKDTCVGLFELDADTVFELLVGYSDRCRKKGVTTGLKFYVEGEALYSDQVLEYLPLKKDKSLLGYHARMEKEFEDYCLVCDELMQTKSPKWSFVTSFMECLYALVGIPNRFSEIGLYLGNYKKTPFGVHVDGCSVLSIPVIGKKKFRVWPSRYVEKHPDLKESFRYPKHIKHSSLLEVGTGDIAYWPSTTWHIAESDGSFSATWSIGVWLNEPLSETFLKIAGPLIQSALGRTGNVTSLPYSDSSLPALLDKSVQLFKQLPENKLRNALEKHYRQKIKDSGFKKT